MIVWKQEGCLCADPILRGYLHLEDHCFPNKTVLLLRLSPCRERGRERDTIFSSLGSKHRGDSDSRFMFRLDTNIKGTAGLQ